MQGRDVFWVHGRSDEAFGASFREIAQLAELMPWGGDQDATLKTVKSWFEAPASGDWTIVIDSLDDIELQSRLYIPVRHGEILFTTRDARILGHPGLVPAGAGIEVSGMGQEEATETFYRIIGSEDPAGSPATGRLLALLDGLPLAIAQAATYIRTSHMSTEHYLDLFQRSEEHQQALLSKPLPATLQYDKTDLSRAVMTTWALSVQKIEQESPLSIKLLNILSFLGLVNIPSSTIEAALWPESGDYFQHLAPLLNFGLLSRLGSSNYRLHRLVRMWMRAKMSSEVKLQCADQAVLLVTNCIPPGSSDNVTKYTSYGDTEKPNCRLELIDPPSFPDFLKCHVVSKISDTGSSDDERRTKLIKFALDNFDQLPPESRAELSRKQIVPVNISTTLLRVPGETVAGMPVNLLFFPEEERCATEDFSARYLDELKRLGMSAAVTPEILLERIDSYSKFTRQFDEIQLKVKLLFTHGKPPQQLPEEYRKLR